MFATRSLLAKYQRGFSLANEYIGSVQASAHAKYSWEAQTTIFLSHSHKDKDLIEPSLAFLRSHGVKVYVDWMDEGMPDTVSGETAKKLKERIKAQQKFIVLVTENSKDSRWVPWELGYADPTKGMEHIAAFPVAEKDNFTHNEYLDIYPKIIQLSDVWHVWRRDPSDIVKLEEWLKR